MTPGHALRPLSPSQSPAVAVLIGACSVGEAGVYTASMTADTCPGPPPKATAQMK